MYTNDESLLFDFHQHALYYIKSLHVEFSSSIKEVDRHRNENTFQMKIQSSANKLKQNLERQALEYISINRHMPTIDWFHKKLGYMIREYIRDFLRWAETV